MPRYIITERAGRFVAGHTNTGVGTALELTERAAAHEVRLGTLIPASGAAQEQASPEPVVAPAAKPPAPDPEPEPDDDHDDEQPAKKRRRGKSKAE